MCIYIYIYIYIYTNRISRYFISYNTNKLNSLFHIVVISRVQHTSAIGQNTRAGHRAQETKTMHIRIQWVFWNVKPCYSPRASLRRHCNEPDTKKNKKINNQIPLLRTFSVYKALVERDSVTLTGVRCRSWSPGQPDPPLGLTSWIFTCDCQGPHFPILCRRLGRKHLSLDPFWKKMARVPRPAKTSEIFPAPDHDLTFPSHVQQLIGKICCHTHFEKKQRRRRSLSAHLRFCSSLAGTSLFHVESQAWPTFFAATPISEKTKAWSAPRLEILNFHMRLSGPSLSHLVSETWPKHLPPDPFWKKMARVQRPAKTSAIFPAPDHDLTFPSRVQKLIGKICCHTRFEKTSAGAAACLIMFIFSSPWQGPHFSMSSPKLGREFLPPPPFLKTRKPDLARTPFTAGAWFDNRLRSQNLAKQAARCRATPQQKSQFFNNRFLQKANS